MKISVQEAAEFLATDGERVTRWIENDDLPAQRIRGQYRINRTDLLEWATARGVAVAPRAFRLDDDAPSLADALRAGGVHREVSGTDVHSVIASIVAELPIADENDRELLRHVLHARESLGVTPVGDGIAIPHARTPIILAPAGAVMALSFLTSPLDLGAPDGRPVDTFFLLLCPTVHVHLAMLARLAYGLRDSAFHAAVRERASAEEIVALAAALEGAFR
ncbi:MAG TPA: PTS sugar transporter subunit IIA [Thermoanaerobaculia bacterium]